MRRRASKSMDKRKVSLVSLYVVADELGVSPEYIRKQMNARKFPRAITCNNMTFFLKDEIVKYIADQAAAGVEMRVSPREFELVLTDEELNRMVAAS